MGSYCGIGVYILMNDEEIETHLNNAIKALNIAAHQINEAADKLHENNEALKRTVLTLVEKEE
jgi:prefoldin subunit 5